MRKYFLIVALVLLAGLAFFCWRSSFQSNNATDTRTWTTYTDKVNGYVIDIPSDLNAYVKTGVTVFAQSNTGITGTVVVEVSTTTLATPEAWLSNYDKTMGFPAQPVKSRIVIDGNSAITTYPSDNMDYSQSKEAIFIKKGKAYIITTNFEVSDTNRDAYKKVWDSFHLISSSQ